MHSFNIDRYLLDKNLIKQAIIFVCKKKHKKYNHKNYKYYYAQKILKNIDKYVDDLYEKLEAYFEVKKCFEHNIFPSEELVNKAYTPAEPRSFMLLCDNNKIRKITYTLIYPDQMVHRLIIMASEKIFMKSMYKYTCGSIPKRGIHYGKKYLKKCIQKENKYSPTNIKYATQMDISKCYPHVSHDKLKDILRKKFRGKYFIWLCFDAIDIYKDSDAYEKARGIPIGFVTSPWFLNFLLTPIDHLIKEKYHIKIYLRYVDDMTLFCRNKKIFHTILQELFLLFEDIGFSIKYNWQLFRFDYFSKNKKRKGRDVNMLGFRFFRDKIALRKHIILSIKRKVITISFKFKNHKKIYIREARSLISNLGWLNNCNTLYFYKKYIQPYIKIKKVKEIISYESRKYNSTARIL